MQDGGERDREEEREGEQKLSLVNPITLVTVCLGQTQQPNTPHLKRKQYKPQQKHRRKSHYVHPLQNQEQELPSPDFNNSLNFSFSDKK